MRKGHVERFQPPKKSRELNHCAAEWSLGKV